MPEVRSYLDQRGRSPFYLWLEDLDQPVSHRIQRVIARMEAGNLGDVRNVGDGVVERRVNFGPGYRIYFAWDGSTLIVLLGGGDKSDQSSDIVRARQRWQDYRTRRAQGSL